MNLNKYQISEYQQGHYRTLRVFYSNGKNKATN